eukprot:3870737-Pleurochrysis_carterae.AAC.2
MMRARPDACASARAPSSACAHASAGGVASAGRPEEPARAEHGLGGGARVDLQSLFRGAGAKRLAAKDDAGEGGGAQLASLARSSPRLRRPSARYTNPTS